MRALEATLGVLRALGWSFGRPWSALGGAWGALGDHLGAPGAWEGRSGSSDGRATAPDLATYTLIFMIYHIILYCY